MVRATGEIEDWQDNSDYRPSPDALGWPEPTDQVDAAVQLASTGYGPTDDVPRSLVDAEVAVLVDADGNPVAASAPNNTRVLPVHTSAAYIEAAGRLAFDVWRVTDHVKQLPDGHQLVCQPHRAGEHGDRDGTLAADDRR
ncbi:type VII secretion system-associated protein [Streptomyces mirabilis]|uniref:type VII secretion system-associated protein n=1 Tax=Streptomyces mirabilis TaxID=68239 RepID=UPI0036539225